MGEPVTGTLAMLEVSLSANAIGTNEFYFVSEEGETIQRCNCTQRIPTATLLSSSEPLIFRPNHSVLR